jgi:glycerophosphoryl diester phosphodiesterase
VNEATPRFIQNVHHRGKRVHVYTVNDSQDMLRLFLNDVDGIFTDDPPLAIKVLDQMGR